MRQPDAPTETGHAALISSVEAETRKIQALPAELEEGTASCAMVARVVIMVSAVIRVVGDPTRPRRPMDPSILILEDQEAGI